MSPAPRNYRLRFVYLFTSISSPTKIHPFLFHFSYAIVSSQDTFCWHLYWLLDIKPVCFQSRKPATSKFRESHLVYPLWNLQPYTLRTAKIPERLIQGCLLQDFLQLLPLADPNFADFETLPILLTNG